MADWSSRDGGPFSCAGSLCGVLVRGNAALWNAAGDELNRRRSDGGVDGEQGFEQGFEVPEVEGVGAVGFGGGGIFVDLKEETVDAGGNGGAGEHRDELGLPAGDGLAHGAASVRGRGGLHGVCGVEDDGSEAAQDGQGAHVNDEVVVAEAGAALGEGDAGAAGVASGEVSRGEVSPGDFFDGVAHVPGGDKLAFFDVEGASGRTAGAGRGEQKISLAAEKGRNLQHGVDIAEGIRGVGGLLGRVDVGKDRDAVRGADGLEDAAAFGEAGTAKGADRGAIGLVVARFEEKREAEIGGDALEGVGQGAGVVFGLEHAGTGDQEELSGADGHVAELKGRYGWHLSIGA